MPVNLHIIIKIEDCLCPQYSEDSGAYKATKFGTKAPLVCSYAPRSQVLDSTFYYYYFYVILIKF